MISRTANLNDRKNEANVAELISGQEGDDAQLTSPCFKTSSLYHITFRDPLVLAENLRRDVRLMTDLGSHLHHVTVEVDGDFFLPRERNSCYLSVYRRTKSLD